MFPVVPTSSSFASNCMDKKQINIDWDDCLAVGKLFNAAKTRYFQLKRASDGAPSRRCRNRGIFESCVKILDTDISSVYSGREFSLDKTYYVYAHLNTRSKIAVGFNGLSTFAASLGMTHMPFYIGKGVGNRCFSEKRSETYGKVVNSIKALGREVVVVKIKDYLTESQAFQLESKLIDIFGLVPQNGYLTNLDEGLHSKERRKFYLSDLTKLRQINEILYK